MNGSCDFWVEILWIVFNTLQQQSLIASLEMRSLLLVAVWCLQKDVNVFSTKGNVSRKSDLKKYSCSSYMYLTSYKMDL